MPNPEGRSLQYKTPEDMQEGIDRYFTECKENEKPLTVSGLAYELDMSTESLRTYGNRDEFSATVKKAKQRVEISLEGGLLKGYNAAGAIFNLKNNFGWKDKTEREHSGEVGGTFKVIHE